MKYLFLEYPKCSTCKKAKAWLDENNMEYDTRHIVEQNPTSEELSKWILQSGLPLKRFFNTSGILYREMKLKDRLVSMTEEEQIEMLSTNGMLVKRPMIIGTNKVLIGFKPGEWEQLKN